MKNLLKFLPYIALLVIVLLYLDKCTKDPEIIEVPVTVFIQAPEIENTFTAVFDPVPLPKPRKVDDSWYNAYKSLKDSIAKDSMVQDLATIRDYKETFEDSVLTIDISAKVRGNLLSLQPSYKLKPFKIRYDTIINVARPKDFFSVDFGVEVGTPLIPNGDPLIVKPELGIRLGKLRISGSYGSDNRAWLGLSYVAF
jgi:hypothetical protein